MCLACSRQTGFTTTRVDPDNVNGQASKITIRILRTIFPVSVFNFNETHDPTLSRVDVLSFNRINERKAVCRPMLRNPLVLRVLLLRRMFFLCSALSALCRACIAAKRRRRRRRRAWRVRHVTSETVSCAHMCIVCIRCRTEGSPSCDPNNACVNVVTQYVGHAQWDDAYTKTQGWYNRISLSS